jgi:hypothetical protein
MAKALPDPMPPSATLGKNYGETAFPFAQPQNAGARETLASSIPWEPLPEPRYRDAPGKPYEIKGGK